MWCPTCKNEYRDGITICPDCQSELIEDLKTLEEKELLFTAETEEIAQDFKQFLDFSEISDYEIVPGEDDSVNILVAKGDLPKAKKLMVGFAAALERNNNEIEDMEKVDLPTDLEEAEIEQEKGKEVLNDLRTGKSTIYVKSIDKYNDIKFSGLSFLLFSALGLLFCALTFSGVFTFFQNSLTLIIMTAIFGLFGVIGVVTLIKAMKIRNSVGEEETKRDEIETWIEEKFTREYIEALFDAELSEEKNYFLAMDIMNDEIQKVYSEDENMLDQMIDEHYSKLFD